MCCYASTNDVDEEKEKEFNALLQTTMRNKTNNKGTDIFDGRYIGQS